MWSCEIGGQASVRVMVCCHAWGSRVQQKVRVVAPWKVLRWVCMCQMCRAVCGRGVVVRAVVYGRVARGEDRGERAMHWGAPCLEVCLYSAVCGVVRVCVCPGWSMRTTVCARLGLRASVQLAGIGRQVQGWLAGPSAGACSGRPGSRSSGRERRKRSAT